MASRLPAAPSLSAFWELLVRGGDAIRDGIPEHLDVADWMSVRSTIGTAGMGRLGSFFDRVDEFDAAFFGMSPHEAVRVSPVHRLLLESVWEAVEDSGATAETLAGSRTAVFTSCLLNSEYWDLLVSTGLHDMHAEIGSAMHGIGPGRISYALDLRGPSMAVDATCAGSLVAVHLACRSIRSGESEMAIVGSVNLQLDARHTAGMVDGGVISPTGACRFGDSRADGTVRSDGAVAVLLKPLGAALADGDRVYATILGTGVSSAGRGRSLVSPSKSGQEAAIRAAHADAGVLPEEIDYVEAHGTGTVEGDHTELSALGEVFGGSRHPDTPCLVGSVKSNVGHTEVAAGLTGLVKTALALRHQIIPSTLHVRQPNPVLSQTRAPLRLVDARRPWPARGSRRLAGVNALGISGMNVHVVLSDVPRTDTKRTAERPPPTAGFLLPVSARATGAVRELARAYAERIGSSRTGERDLCFSAGARRTQHQYRIAVVASDHEELVDGLRAAAYGDESESVVVGTRAVYDKPRVVFVFPGQSSQWTGMARELFKHSPVFQARLRECDAAVRAELGWSIVDRLASDEPLVEVDEVQPVLWGIQVSLAAVWRDSGIEPDLLIGHSMGEIAAATVSGAMSIRDGAAIICRRSNLIRRRHQPGGMVAVQLGEGPAREAIGELADRVTVGVINSPYATVLSGDLDALTEVVEPLRSRGVFCRTIPVDFASHCFHMEPLRAELLAELTGVSPRRGRIPLLSTALGCELDGPEMDAAYWMTNLCEPVRFSSAVHEVLADRQRTLFVEISPHPVLAAAIEDTIESVGGDAVVIGSLHRGKPEVRSLLIGLAQAYVHGCTLDWARLNPGGRFVPLPSYPWQRKRFWVNQLTSVRHRPPLQVVNSVVEPEPARPRAVAHLDVERQFLELVADLLTMRPDEVDTMMPLTHLGMDSLLAHRLRARLKQDLGVELSARDLFGPRTVADLARELCEPPPAA